MFLSRLFLLLLSANICNGNFNKNKRLGHALLDSYSFYHEKHFKTVHFIQFTDEKYYTDELIEFATSDPSSDIKFMLNDLSDGKRTKMTRTIVNVALIDSMRSFRNFMRHVEPSNMNNGGFFLIVLLNGQSQDVLEIFQVFWKLLMSNVNVILENTDGNIELLTFFPKRERSCSDVTPVVINHFADETKKWIKPFTYPEKFSNYHQCPMRIAFYEVYGFEGAIFGELAQMMNFSVQKVPASPVFGVGSIFPNGTATGSMEHLKDGKIDIIVRLLALDETRTTFFSFVNSFYEDWIVIVVPPPPELTPLMKLFYPFETVAWLALLGFLFSACAFILILEHFSAKWFTFVLGRNMRHPLLNLVAEFSGAPQPKLPTGTFARCILAMFLLFSLVVRTMYTGKLFFIMKSQVRAKVLETMDEFYDAGYKFYVHDGIANKIKDFKYYDK